MDVKSVFTQIPEVLPEELFETLAQSENVTIERIVSRGHCSPENFWYDQEEHEWVLVLKGRAGLLFEGEHEAVVLGPGDYINIPAHVRHRVAWTDAGQETVWLAVYY